MIDAAVTAQQKDACNKNKTRGSIGLNMKALRIGALFYLVIAGGILGDLLFIFPFFPEHSINDIRLLVIFTQIVNQIWYAIFW